MFGLQFEHDRQFTTLPAMHALTMEHGVDFNQICHGLSVEPLSSFLARMRYDSDSEDGEPEWYSADLGHTTFFAMFAFFSSHLDRIPTEIKSEPPMSREEFLEELQQCVTILGNRRHERFHTIVILYVPEGIEI